MFVYLEQYSEHGHAAACPFSRLYSESVMGAPYLIHNHVLKINLNKYI